MSVNNRDAPMNLYSQAALQRGLDFQRSAARRDTNAHKRSFDVRMKECVERAQAALAERAAWKAAKEAELQAAKEARRG